MMIPNMDKKHKNSDIYDFRKIFHICVKVLQQIVTNAHKNNSLKVGE